MHIAIDLAVDLVTFFARLSEMPCKTHLSS
jgi:hypothetical protein